MNSMITSILSSIGSQVPLLLLCVLGLVFALQWRPRAPQAMTAVMISLIVLFILALARPVIFQIIVQSIRGQATSIVLMIWNFIANLLETAAVAGLVYAAFSDRSPANPKGSNPYAGDYYSPPAAFPPPGAAPQPTSFPGPQPLPHLGEHPRQ